MVSAHPLAQNSNSEAAATKLNRLLNPMMFSPVRCDKTIWAAPQSRILHGVKMALKQLQHEVLRLKSRQVLSDVTSLCALIGRWNQFGDVPNKQCPLSGKSGHSMLVNIGNMTVR